MFRRLLISLKEHGSLKKSVIAGEKCPSIEKKSLNINEMPINSKFTSTSFWEWGVSKQFGT